ncbi:putative WRKY transcription factor 3 [Camellia lanceoleosa]|uniref:WRKY transcription factor 3 n=1 Tax=Camellia lanceoleosa TaxID=1840588 RepID=A0ACC0IT24_9ERIC|nr:putative WRKY transcription factor 3 [Camellia lanceoleosa]
MAPQMTTLTWAEPPSMSRNTNVKVLEPASSNRVVAEPRIIVQTTSEVDLLDDGESIARKLLKEILIQGNTFTQLGLLIHFPLSATPYSVPPGETLFPNPSKKPRISLPTTPFRLD